MHTGKGQRWFALATAFGFAATAAQAAMITPDSIPNPPSAVASANFTPVYASNFVTTQYNGLGLNFSGGATITNLNGVSVWAPTESLMQPLSRISGGPPPNFPTAQLNYYGTWSGINFVQPGTLKPSMATSLSVEIIGRQNLGFWVQYANSPNATAVTPTKAASEPNGGTLYTFAAGPGITSFTVTAPVPVDPPMKINPQWGVAEVSIALAHAPEPSSLVLAGLGALGLAARFGWRRNCGAIE